MKKNFTTLLLIFISFYTYAQTNVTGGIYSSTTWTVANSPYIISDTVLVFPNLTLTIEPGVTVEFNDGAVLYLRSSALIANGTPTDSITFTSSSSAPYPGIYGGVYLNDSTGYPGNPLQSSIMYCNFNYGVFGLWNNDLLNMTHSSFEHNICGLYYIGGSWSSDKTIDTCNFAYNTQYGIHDLIGYPFKGCTVSHNNCGMLEDVQGNISNCQIEFNNTGVLFHFGGTMVNSVIASNGVGVVLNQLVYTINTPAYKLTGNIIQNDSIGILAIKISHPASCTFSCNKLCSNTSYSVYNNTDYNLNFSGNDWCSTDSATVRSQVYDGYKNIALGLIILQPFDNSQCYLTGCNIKLNSVYVIDASCDTCRNGLATVYPINGVPPYSYSWNTSPLQTTQAAIYLTPGSYTVCVKDAAGCTACSNPIVVDTVHCANFFVNANVRGATCSSCNDGMAWLNVSGNHPPFTYKWNTSPIQTTDTAVGLLPGTYYVCVTNAYGCSICDSVTIPLTSSCSALFFLYPDTIPHYYFAVNEARGVPPITYLWSWGDDSTSTGAYPSHSYATANFYQICLTIIDSIGCTSHYCSSFYLERNDNPVITVAVVSSAPNNNNPTAAAKAAPANSFTVYPNPAHNLLSVVFASPLTKNDIRIYNILGQTIFDSVGGSNPKTDIDISGLASGVYTIEVVSNNQTDRKQFVKQ